MRVPKTGTIFLQGEAQRYMGCVVELLDELVSKDVKLAELEGMIAERDAAILDLKARLGEVPE